VRIALDARGTMVLADTQVDGELHLNESFRQIRVGMLTALGQDAEPGDSADSIPPQRVDEAIAAMAASHETVVKHDNAWELRTRVAAGLVPVRLSIEQADLVVRHSLAANLPDASERVRVEAAAHHALWVNGRLRHARLAVCDGRLVAETRLHRRVLSAHWLRQSAGAVAYAALHALPALRVLLCQPRVRELYAAWFPAAIAPDSGPSKCEQ
jgi:hypothetical protein